MLSLTNSEKWSILPNYINKIFKFGVEPESKIILIISYTPNINETLSTDITCSKIILTASAYVYPLIPSFVCALFISMNK